MSSERLSDWNSPETFEFSAFFESRRYMFFENPFSPPHHTRYTDELPEIADVSDQLSPRPRRPFPIRKPPAKRIGRFHRQTGATMSTEVLSRRLLSPDRGGVKARYYSSSRKRTTGVRGQIVFDSVVYVPKTFAEHNPVPLFAGLGPRG